MTNNICAILRALMCGACAQERGEDVSDSHTTWRASYHEHNTKLPGILTPYGANTCVDYWWGLLFFARGIRLFFVLHSHIWMGAWAYLKHHFYSHTFPAPFSCGNIFWTYSILDSCVGNLGKNSCWVFDCMGCVDVE